VVQAAYTTYDDGTECSEASAHEIQMPGSRPERKTTRNNISFTLLRFRFALQFG